MLLSVMLLRIEPWLTLPEKKLDEGQHDEWEQRSEGGCLPLVPVSGLVPSDEACINGTADCAVPGRGTGRDFCNSHACVIHV